VTDGFHGTGPLNRAAQRTMNRDCSDLSSVEVPESHFPYSRSRLGGYIKGARAHRAEPKVRVSEQ
jgi:hypothetical protein